MTPSPCCGAGGRRGFREQPVRQASGVPKGHYSGGGCAFGSWEPHVEKRVAGGEREERRQKGEGDLILLGEERCCLPPPGEAGAVSGGGSILSLPLSLCLPIRFFSLGSPRIPGTENEAIAYTNI